MTDHSTPGHAAAATTAAALPPAGGRPDPLTVERDTPAVQLAETRRELAEERSTTLTCLGVIWHLCQGLRQIAAGDWPATDTPGSPEDAVKAYAEQLLSDGADVSRAEREIAAIAEHRDTAVHALERIRRRLESASPEEPPGGQGLLAIAREALDGQDAGTIAVAALAGTRNAGRDGRRGSSFPIHARFSYPEDGWDGDRKRAAELLTPGRVYLISKMEVGNSLTEIFLHDFPGVGFNSVMFEAAGDPDDEEDGIQELPAPGAEDTRILDESIRNRTRLLVTDDEQPGDADGLAGRLAAVTAQLAEARAAVAALLPGGKLSDEDARRYCEIAWPGVLAPLQAAP